MINKYLKCEVCLEKNLLKIGEEGQKKMAMRN